LSSDTQTLRKAYQVLLGFSDGGLRRGHVICWRLRPIRCFINEVDAYEGKGRIQHSEFLSDLDTQHNHAPIA
jgi:hypothetical protein